MTKLQLIQYSPVIWTPNTKCQVKSVFNCKKYNNHFVNDLNCLNKVSCSLLKQFGSKNIIVVAYTSTDETIEMIRHVPRCIRIQLTNATSTFLDKFDNVFFSLFKNNAGLLKPITNASIVGRPQRYTQILGMTPESHLFIYTADIMNQTYLYGSNMHISDTISEYTLNESLLAHAFDDLIF
jgi:hypothetical protein